MRRGKLRLTNLVVSERRSGIGEVGQRLMVIKE